MTKKLAFSVLIVMFIVVGVTTGVAQAQTASFPSGCASGLGYSATTGNPCNGTNTATNRYMPGCSSSALGYSATTGEPCSGGSVAIQWLAGCTSTVGFSSIDGSPCNGTARVTPVVLGTSNPGLPTTGAGGNASMNIILLLASAGVAAFGAIYLSRGSKASVK
ncbi:MAG: hypothetical protein V4486_02240 [Patescibacteria group bacterium]